MNDLTDSPQPRTVADKHANRTALTADIRERPTCLVSNHSDADGLETRAADIDWPWQHGMHDVSEYASSGLSTVTGSVAPCNVSRISSLVSKTASLSNRDAGTVPYAECGKSCRAHVPRILTLNAHCRSSVCWRSVPTRRIPLVR